MLIRPLRSAAMTASIQVAETPLVLFTLARADDALILAHRLSEWCGHGPTPEEDIALANLGLDLLGQARSLYTYAAEAEGQGRAEDHFAYLRDERQFRNLLLVEQPSGCFGQTIVRQFLYAAYADPWWRAMCRSGDPALGAIACKAEKEMAYHLRHSAEWVIRLGDGTQMSRRRAQEALDRLWPYTGEMFETEAEAAMIEAGIACDPAGLRAEFEKTVDTVLAEATLNRPTHSWTQSGGRAGRHTEHLGRTLAEMQHLHRCYPGAKW